MNKIDELLAQMSGRSQFCRDRGEIKTPEMLDEAAATIRALREALEDVRDPMRNLRRYADAEGRQIGPMAYSIANDIHFIQRIAKDALEASHGREG